jgi:hypothetical protein
VNALDGNITKGNALGDKIVLVELSSIKLEQIVVVTYQAIITFYVIVSEVIPINASVYYLFTPRNTFNKDQVQSALSSFDF